MTEHEMQTRPYPLGAHCEGDRIRFSFVSAKENCGVVIYSRETGKKLARIPFDPGLRVGDVRCCYVTGYAAEEITYQFYEEGRAVPDPHAGMFVGESRFGRERTARELRAGFASGSFDWQGTLRPRIPYSDCICYLLHVRGFTRHSSSGVEHRGTFRGVTEKLSYLQEIGVTTVELQPAYEFDEMPSVEERQRELPCPVKEEDLDALVPRRLNYWGYKRGYYYAPKAAYASGDACCEFKEMVREFHKRGMEIVMQFYFPREVSFLEIPEILRYWLTEYHVDGFHLLGERLPVDLLAGDPVFADTKLWYDDFKTMDFPCRYPASYRDDYLYAMRKFLKGDENMTGSVLYQMRHIPERGGRIHYLSNYYGMTLRDMVSYDRKHNEENGEENRDGSDYNCSWNCGEEGPTRRRRVTALRSTQIRNAMCMLLLSQSTPLIFMGDEFGNSQGGNNNPYCQDNTVAWLDWRELGKNEGLHSFWKELVALRKAHPILHPEREFRIMDTIACGYPDLSYHGRNAWRPQTEPYSRCVGIMYCGKYARIDPVTEDDFFYVAMNMHWETGEFGLPRLPKGLRWELLLCTSEEFIRKRLSAPQEGHASGAPQETADTGRAEEFRTRVPARSIAIFHSVPDESDGTGGRKRHFQKRIRNDEQGMAAL